MSIKNVLTIPIAFLAVTQAAAQDVEPKTGGSSVVATTSARTTILEGARLSWSFDGTPRLVVAQSQRRVDITSHVITLTVPDTGDGNGATKQRVYYVDFN